MNVLQLGKFYAPVVGGMETALRDICEQLSREVNLHVLVANTAFRTTLDIGRVPVTRVASLGKLFSCSMAPTFPLWARRFGMDLLHVHLPNPLAELSAFLVSQQVPIVAHFHSDIVRQQRLLKLYRPFLKRFYEKASHIIVPTPKHIEISDFVRPHHNKCRIVPYGIALERFDLDGRSRKRVSELSDGLPAILFVGRLVSYKGVEVLIRAMRGIRARLWIVGSGPLEHPLRQLAITEGVADKIRFLGEVAPGEMVAYYHACSMFVLPSVTHAEMFGIVQLEAMACRKPVISSNLATGVSWVNQHGTTGLLVTPGNVAELATAIEYLLASPGLRGEMGEAGRRRVEQTFTSARMAAGVLDVYREALGVTERAPFRPHGARGVVAVRARSA
jgi:glycosyltransferase involved in cell wall biosynthesis